ncbi:hypothetical protein [Actinophytocola gossypii]|uniref:Uncharacterized protein n=1 Tax=Actinophytocola gossypii TaxID=2812003 RepID=A0ABT2JHM4_9PSEU|nr:hypothetical protein [Actinophytocola gossypii]MCT2587238.1 hypothetical protein [Actinophytocola gossypii]
MADNSYPPPGPPGDEPTPPRGELILPPPQPPAQPPVARQPSEPAPLDPDEFRQFQEFKQFQELMRQQREQGVPPGLPPGWGPPPRQNPVKRALRAVGGKIATAVIVVLLLVAAGYLAIDYFLGGPPAQPPASQIGGRQQEGTLLFEENPRAAVQRVYDDVAQGDPESACGRFTEEARADFAEHFASYGDTCEEVVAGLNAEVVPGQKSEYANPAEMTSVTRGTTTDSVTVSSCTIGVQGGPPLGRMTVTRDWNSKGTNQWIVTAHEAETCTGVPSVPTTS